MDHTKCPPDRSEADLARLLARQHAVVHRRQVRELGLTPRMIAWRLKTGRWIGVHRGVYRLAGAPLSWHQTLMAAWLAAGPGAVASHRSAAALWSIDGFDRGRPEVSVVGVERIVTGTRVVRPRRLAIGDGSTACSTGLGVLLARFDLALPDANIAFEFESYRHHFGRQAWRRDVGRNNDAAAHGWLVFRITEDDLRSPNRDFLAAVADAYRARLAAA